jgi:class 3 adenylate cyclase
MMFTKVMKARQVTIDATVLFADLRGYTLLSQSRSVGAISEMLDAFYDECAEAIWNHGGLLNKTMGDAIMAIFNFPIRQNDHPRQPGTVVIVGNFLDRKPLNFRHSALLVGELQPLSIIDRIKSIVMLPEVITKVMRLTSSVASERVKCPSTCSA